MSLSKLINSGISFIGKNHANIDKLSGIAKTKKFDIKTLGDAALFLPFGWQVKGLIWVGTRVYATYTSADKKSEDFEDIREVNDASVSMVNHFLTEAVMTNVHSSKFEFDNSYVNATHTRDAADENWNQTTLTTDFLTDFVETIFNKIYVTDSKKTDLSVSQLKDMKLKVGGKDSVSKDVIVRVKYDVISENQYTLTLRIYLVEEGEIKSGQVNLELDQADVEELISVLETKRERNTVLDSLLQQSKESLDTVQRHAQNTYVFAKNKAQDLVLVATLKGVILYPKVKDKVLEISDEVVGTVTKTYDSVYSFITSKFEKAEEKKDEGKDDSEKWDNREFGASEDHVGTVDADIKADEEKDTTVENTKKPE
jgi:hypothetical protein